MFKTEKRITRINDSNYKDKTLRQQKWGVKLTPRKKHRAYYGSVLVCDSPRCINEPFYQKQWSSYIKTGKVNPWAYGMKINYKWACITCAKKWIKTILGKSAKYYHLPKLPEYKNPAHEMDLIGPKLPCIARPYDKRFC